MLRSNYRALIIGSGICGSSIAYHLTELGWRDVVVVDQGPLIQGTTSHAPGLVGQLRASATLVKILTDSVALYRTLSAGDQPAFSEVGSLRLASSRERLDELKRQAGFARTVGLPAELIGPAEAARLFPLMSLERVEGALFLPTDGSARAPSIARALADGARSRGAHFEPEARVTGFEMERGRIRAVLTTRGRVETEVVVCAAGIWSPRVGRMAGVAIPLVPMQHQYVVTAPIPELREASPSLPNVRDPDNLVYVRRDGDCMVLGGYEHDPAPFDSDAIPVSGNPSVRAFEDGRFEPLLAGGRARFPWLREARLEKKVNGLESFTPDGEFILGESAEVRGFWAACGFCAHGVAGSGGVGKALAEWIVEGEPALDVWHMDIRRFAGHHASRRYVAERATEIYTLYYSISYPGQERTSARGLRLSPLQGRLKDLGAVFGEKAGWERANWFAPNERLEGAAARHRPRGWAGRFWSPAIAIEHQAARERVALFDETSFSKLEVSGPGALQLLERLATNRMDRPVGSITYTQMLNRRGGVECDVTVTRLAEDRFRIITGTAFGPHDLAWVRSHLPADGSVQAADITSSLCTIGVWGPRARDLLSRASDDDFSNEAFPYLMARRVTVGMAPALACRVTYVGELGWELYAPVEYAVSLWDALREAGEPLGALAAGYKAIDSLRLEKGYRYWSAELDADHNPLEAGMRFSVKLDKGDFIGREALEKVRAEGLRRQLCCIVLDDPGAVALGGEAILAGGRPAGRVTSGGYGYTVEKSIAYGYLPIESSAPGTRVAVDLFGEGVPGTVAAEPLYDPKNARVKA